MKPYVVKVSRLIAVAASSEQEAENLALGVVRKECEAHQATAYELYLPRQVPEELKDAKVVGLPLDDPRNLLDMTNEMFQAEQRRLLRPARIEAAAKNLIEVVGQGGWPTEDAAEAIGFLKKELES